MTKLQVALMVLAAVAVAIPVARTTAQSEPTLVAPTDFTVAPDSKSGGVWRLNARTGELWFCLASATPKCYPAENVSR
jgi:hypothetical protein